MCSVLSICHPDFLLLLPKLLGYRDAFCSIFCLLGGDEIDSPNMSIDLRPVPSGITRVRNCSRSLFARMALLLEKSFRLGPTEITSC